MTSSARRHLPFLIAVFAVAAVAVASVIALRIDISAARYFRGDTVVRDAFPESDIPRPIHYDPAPWVIWIPSDHHVRDSIRAGHLPLWDRTQGGGYSPVLTFQNGVFHPLRWLLALVPRDAAPSVLMVIVAALGFSGMWLLLRAGFETSVLGATAGALLFTFSSALLSFAHFSGASLPLAHLPWVALALLHASRRKTLLDAVPLVIAIALLALSGHPLLIAAVAVAVFGIACVEAWDSGSVRPLATLLLGGVAAAILTAFALVPPVAARGELWSYKTGSHAGSVYAPFYPLSEWTHAFASIVVDRHRSYIDDTRFAVTIGFSAAALGLVGFFSGLVSRRGGGLFLLAVAMVMLAIPGPWMVDVSSVRPLDYMNRWYFSGALAFVLAILIARGFDVLSRHRRWRAVAILLAVIACGESLARTWRVLRPERRREIAGGDVIARLRGEPGHVRVTGFVGATHLPNVSRLTGIEDARISAPILPLRMHLWWLAVDPNNRRFAFPTMRVTDRLDSALVPDFNIRYVLQSRLPSEAGMHNAPGARDSTLSRNLAQFPLVLRTPSIELRAVPGAKPRAHLAPRVIVVPTTDAAVAMLARDRTLARDVAVVESAPLRLPEEGQGKVSVRYPDDLRVEIDVTTPSGGLVVLHDSFDRGWKATLDGAPAKILPVNILSRGVVVPAGSHRIAMAYRPPGFAAGLAISAATLVALIALGLASARSPSRGSRASPEAALQFGTDA